MTLQAIPDGPRGINLTLRAMSRFTKTGKRQYQFRDLALSLVQGLKPKDWRGEINRLYKFVQNDIRYVRDIRGVETVAAPNITLQIGQGDCDDKSVLLATLLESIGHPTRFVAVGFSPGKYCHVLVETKLGKKWVSLETTEPVTMGWYPPGVVSRMVFYN